MPWPAKFTKPDRIRLVQCLIGICLIVSLLLTGCLPQETIPPVEPTRASATITDTPKPTITVFVKEQNPTLVQTSEATPNFTPTHPPPSPIPTSTPFQTSFCSPLKDLAWADLQAILSTPFRPPSPGKDNGHQGSDFAFYRYKDRGSIAGTTIQAVMPGRVAGRVLNRVPYGNMVIVETPYTYLPVDIIDLLQIPEGQSVYTLYAHMADTPLVVRGQQVNCGQALGVVGNTPKGWSSSPHLHFEVRSGPAGFSFENMVFYDTSASVEEMDTYKRWRMSGEFQLYDPMIVLERGLSDSTLQLTPPAAGLDILPRPR